MPYSCFLRGSDALSTWYSTTEDIIPSTHANTTLRYVQVETKHFLVVLISNVGTYLCLFVLGGSFFN